MCPGIWSPWALGCTVNAANIPLGLRSSLLQLEGVKSRKAKGPSGGLGPVPGLAPGRAQSLAGDQASPTSLLPPPRSP